MTIVATMCNQKRKVYNQSVANNAFFFLIIWTFKLAIVNKTYFSFNHIKEHSPNFYHYRSGLRLPDGKLRDHSFQFRNKLAQESSSFPNKWTSTFVPLEKFVCGGTIEYPFDLTMVVNALEPPSTCSAKSLPLACFRWRSRNLNWGPESTASLNSAVKHGSKPSSGRPQ